MKLTDAIKITSPSPRSQKLFRQDHWEASIGGAKGTGDSSDEAVNDLRKTVKEAFRGSYDTHIIPFRGTLGVVWRSPYSWEYQIVNLAEVEGQDKRLWGTSSGFETEEAALKTLRYHLAQSEWNGVEETSPLILDEKEQKEFGRWTRWQKRYAQLKKEGMDDNAICYQLLREGL